MPTPLDALVTLTQEHLAVIGQRRAEGTIDTLAFRMQAQQVLKDSHIAAAALARGGWDQMDASTRGAVGARLRFQYDRLSVLALDTRPGDFGAQALARLAMYGSAPRGTFYAVSRRDAGDGAQAQNTLGAGDHCAECEAETARGWVPADEMSLPGERTCLSNCGCTLEFRTTVGEGAAA